MNRELFTELLKASDYKTIRGVLAVMDAADIAALLPEITDDRLAVLFRLLDKKKAADVFSNMSKSAQTCLVEIFTEKELKELLEELFMDDTVDLLEDLPANLVTRILKNVSVQKRKEINKFLNYPQDSAGSVMTTEFVALHKETTVEQALDYIKRTGIHKETIYTCYVLEHKKLLGIVTAKDLLTMERNVAMQELMNTEVISVDTHTDQETVVKMLAKYDFLAIPVLDSEGLMVGIITVDDAIDVLEEETTEDMSIMAAVTPSDKPYFEVSVFHHAKNRILWLLVLMVSATFTGMIITRYENAFAVVPLLVSFIPMLMDTGGNCGSQSSTLIIRGLALDEIKMQDIFRVMFKEFRISILVGIVLATANGLRIFLMYQDAPMALVVGLSLAATVVLSKMIGCVLPILAKRVHLDPAIMAAPLITTVVDACSVMIYFKIATIVFSF